MERYYAKLFLETTKKSQRTVYLKSQTRKRDFQAYFGMFTDVGQGPDLGRFSLLKKKNPLACLQMDLARSSDGVERSTAALNLLQYHLGQQSRTFRSVWEWFNAPNSACSLFFPLFSAYRGVAGRTL